MREVNRHEEKFLITLPQAALLAARLRAVARPDPHARPDGSYFIRSVYFDDTFFSAYNDKLSGTEHREKFRLRFYNFDARALWLEKKIKHGNLTGKRSARVDAGEAAEMLVGGGLSWTDRDPLLAEFAYLRRQTLRPVTIVDYDRYAFIYPVEDVRITLDMDIRTAPYRANLFDSSLPTVPALEDGEGVLEIKFNSFLPSHLALALEDVPKQRLAVSKYVKCLSYLE